MKKHYPAILLLAFANLGAFIIPQFGESRNELKFYNYVDLALNACPTFPAHGIVEAFVLLPGGETQLGMGLPTSGQLIPEQFTAPIIVHHKDAKYYSVGESRVEQLMKTDRSN